MDRTGGDGVGMHRVKVTAAVVLAGLLLTAGAALRVAETQRAGLEQRLLVDAVAYAGALQSELERYVGAAYALRDLFDDGPVVTRPEYERAIEALGPEQFPSLHGINVVRPVAPHELPRFVSEKRAGGYAHYTVEEPPPGDETAERWLVSLVAPFETNGHLLGQDIHLEPGLSAPFERARDDGEPSLGPVVGDADAAHARVGLAVPVYAVGQPTDTVDERRDHHVGWVVSTVRTDELAKGLAAKRGLEVVVSEAADGTVIRRAGVADGDHRLAVQRTIGLYGRLWTVRAAPGPAYVAGVERHAPAWIVALGLLVTGALAGLVHVLGQRSAHAQRMVELRTGELAHANGELSVVNDELAMRLDELRQHTSVEELVQRATAEVGQALTVQDALERLRVVLLGVAPFDRVGFSVRLDEQRMQVRDVAGPGTPIAPVGVEYVASRRVWESFTTRDLVVVRDTVGAEPGSLAQQLADRGIRGIVTLPLVARGEVAGTLALATSEPLSLSPGDVQQLARVTGGISGPIVTLLGFEAERLAAEQLRHVDELKDEFLGVVAHDLRGPLSVVTGYTDLLLSECATGPLDPELAQQALTAMQRAASNQQRLIADLLESQRLALGVAVPALAPLALGDLVRATVRDVAAGRPMQVAFEDLSDGAGVSADPAWIQRVVTNLTTNAATHGSPDVDVRVTTEPGSVRVEVTDHGDGIPSADIPRLFQRFSRLNGRAGGTGLGLYICRQLVEAHGGAIGVDSTVGWGSTFWFALPMVGVPATVPS